MEAIQFDDQVKMTEMLFQSTLKMKEDLIILLFSDYINLVQLKNKASMLKQTRDQLQIKLVELSKVHYHCQQLQFLLDGYINLLGFGQNKKLLFKRRKSSITMRKNTKQFNFDQSLFDKDCCIVFLTLVNKIGTIKKYQDKFTSLFGYQNKEIQDKNISLIIPNPIKKHHDQLLQRYIKGSQQAQQREQSDQFELEDEVVIDQIDQQNKNGNFTTLRQILERRSDFTSRYFPIFLAINSKGWAIPISVTFKFDSINQEDCGITGLIQKLHSDYYYMQIDSDNFQIQAISQQLYQKAFDGIFIQNDIQKIYFNRFAPFLRYYSQISTKKLQQPNPKDIGQSCQNQNKETDLKINLNSNQNKDTFKTIIFIPKINTSEKKSIFCYDQPLMNDEQLQQQMKNYSLEHYDIYIAKFKIYHQVNQLFKYDILEFHSFRKINDFFELKESLIKLQRKFLDILQIDFDIAENIHLIDQLQNAQIISQTNINSFIEIIEQELQTKCEDQFQVNSDYQNQDICDKIEENIEPTNRSQQQNDNRSNLNNLDLNQHMITGKKVNQRQLTKQIYLNQIIDDAQQPQQQNKDSIILNYNLDQQIKNDQNLNKNFNNQLLNPQRYKYQNKMSESKDKELKNYENKIQHKNELYQHLELSYSNIQPFDQSYNQSDNDYTKQQLYQQNYFSSFTDRQTSILEIEDITSNQNNVSLVYSGRKHYNELNEFNANINQLQQQNTYIVEIPQQDDNLKISTSQNNNDLYQLQTQQSKLIKKEYLDDILNAQLYPSILENGSLSLLSPNQINTSKPSLNTTTSRHLIQTKVHLNDIVLQRLNDEIQKETDRDRLVKMESLRKNLKNHQIDDLTLWRLKSLQKSQKNTNNMPSQNTFTNLGVFDKKSKVETSQIVRAEVGSLDDCTDTVDREERIKRELQERSRIVAVSSRQSSHSNSTDLKRNLKKSLYSKKRNLLMILLTGFGLIALTSVMTLTLFQYFKTNYLFQVIKTDFNFIPWAIDLRCDYMVPLLYQGVLKLIKTGQFNSLKDPAYPPIIYQRMQKSHVHLFKLYNFYQTADINHREYFRYINDNPIDLILGIDDVTIKEKKEYHQSEKIIQKVNLDYFIQTLAAYQFNVVSGEGYTDYLEKVQIDNFKTFEEQSTLVSDVAMDCAVESNETIVIQTLILLVLVIAVSFVLIAAIFPLYYYVQTNNQQSLKLFATISSEHLASMLKPIQYTLIMSKSIKILTTNFNLNFKDKYKKRKNITPTTMLPKFQLKLLIFGLIGFVTLIIQPIVNYILLDDFKNEASMNIKLLDTLYSIRSFLITNSALNYQYLAYRTDPNIYLYNTQFFMEQIPIMNKKAAEKINEMYTTVKQDQSKSRYKQELYDEFLYKILSENLCDVVKKYPEYISIGFEIDDKLCNSVRSGLLLKGFNLAIKDYLNHIQTLEQIYSIQNRDEFQEAVKIWTEQTKMMEFDEYFILQTRIIVIMKDFMIKVMNDYLSYMNYIQTVLLIFQILALIFLFIFGWMNFYITIQKEIILIKQLFSVLSIETVLENPYIISYLNK